MHHLHVDRFAGIHSPVHRLDPRVKIVLALILVFTAVLIPESYFLSFGLFILLLSVIILIARIPVLYVIERTLILLPFVIIVSLFVPFITPGKVITGVSLGFTEAVLTREGLVRFAAIGLKSLISFLAILTLVSTTRFLDLMRAAGSLGFPTVLAGVLTFMYRYLFILLDDAAHMMLARDLRAGKGRHHSILFASGGIIGGLFVRSFEHADRLFHAMILRGYSGRPVTLSEMKAGTADILTAVITTLGIAAVCLAGVIVHG